MNINPNATMRFSLRFARGLNALIFSVLLLVQSACANNLTAAPTTHPKEGTPVTDTPTPKPSKTPSPSPTTTSTPSIIGAWSDAPAMAIPRSAHAVANSDSAIYALAGTDDHGKPVFEVEVFDGKDWKTETTLPGEGLNAPTASVVDQKLYVVGGFLAVSSSPTNEVQVYDLQTQQWSNASPLPNPRGGHVAVVLDGRIHVFGGGNSVSTLADHSEYDPATDSWRDLAPLPRSEGSPAAVAIDGKIYVIGGRSGFSDFGDVYIYDPETDTWSTGPSIDPRGTAGAVYYCGGIYLFGGESQSQRKNLDEAWRLDLERNVWEPVTAMPIARKFARAVVFMNSVFIVGGSVVPASSHSPIGSNSVLKFTQPGCS
ncbi:MAG TPA: kelch repeat-containing protein [Anaerolineales bacterium]|nr:kelch repeat-containing protein [Anaerolineales bacterium]HNJ14336.1 kelch repeat-containing protein [Anaerolineales bacterium]